MIPYFDEALFLVFDGVLFVLIGVSLSFETVKDSFATGTIDLGACFCGVFVALTTVLVCFSLDYLMFFDDLRLSFSLLLLTDMVL